MQELVKEIRVGVAGLGWAGIRQSEAVLKMKGVRLSAAADSNELRRSEFGKLFPEARLFRNVGEMIEDDRLDAVVVCLPNFLHHSVSIAALRAGKHVLCEKPPALDASQMREIRDEAERRSLVYAFGRQMRFTGSMMAAREIIRSGRLGEIYFARSVWTRARGIPVGVGDWFLNREKAGGGAVIDIGIHALDSAWHLMGAPKPLSVSAAVSTRFRHHLSSETTFDVDDSGFAFLRFANGAVLHLEVSWAGNLPDDVPENKAGEREEISTIIYGRKASLRLDPLTVFEDRDGVLVDVPIEIDSIGRGFREQMEDFIGAIRSSKKPMNDVDQALSLMEMLDAIYESSARRREVLFLPVEKEISELREEIVGKEFS